MWLIAAVDSSIGWPTVDTEVTHNSRSYILRPESKQIYADIITDTMQDKESSSFLEDLFRFCSILSWIKSGSVTVLETAFESDKPERRTRKPKIGSKVFTAFNPIDTSDDIDRLLALYREALTVNSPLFSFLGFFKILNTKLSGDDQKVWISNNTSRLTSEIALKRLEQLTKLGIEPSQHLYNNLRTAIVHSSVWHNVDPDNPNSVLELQSDLPLMKNLAELFIEDELGTV